MPRVLDIVRRLLPEGSRAQPGDWTECPVWPPDAFAVAATLLDRSNCYANPDFSGRTRPLFGAAYRARVRTAGKAWRERVIPPPSVQRLWRTIVEDGDRELGERGAFEEAAITLVSCADEACFQIGFADPKLSKLAQYVEYAHWRFVETRGRDPVFANIRRTLCLKVPPTEACVQPKSRTSQVGCTLRTLTHHLALLPGVGHVRSRWQLSYGTRDGPLNLMLVPFPYRIDGRAFVRGPDIDDEGAEEAGSSLFSMEQTWFPASGATARRDMLRFVRGLVGRARANIGPVNGIVFPELALDPAMARSIARELVRDPDVELFVAGVVDRRVRRRPANAAFTAVIHFQDRGGALDWTQRKHHRWCIERSQIRRYHLGHELSPSRRWWEDTHLGEREVHLCEFRPGATLCVLICEDLARIDPVQPVLRAIGPNLVVALLLDGPQREFRWPGRYATVLADDPGSAVLTLTSLGMVRRSADPGEAEPRQIALFKDSPGTRAQELSLPVGSHALVLTLTPHCDANLTFDGRSDAFRDGKLGRGGTVRLSLDGIHPVEAPWVPRWMRV